MPATPETNERVPLSRMRRAISAAMTMSAQVPQFTLERAAEMGPLHARRRALREEGIGASISDVLTAACARGLRAHPCVNASFDEDAIVRHCDINVGLAVALPDGLVTPAILHADRLDLGGLAAARTRLAAAARAGKLRGAELSAATFSISNLGPLGIDRFRALVIPPQAAILAVGAVLEHPGGRSSMSLSISCDHRVLDGAPAAEFLATVVEALEAPSWIDELARSSAGASSD